MRSHYVHLCAFSLNVDNHFNSNFSGEFWKPIYHPSCIILETKSGYWLALLLSFGINRPARSRHAYRPYMPAPHSAEPACHPWKGGLVGKVSTLSWVSYTITDLHKDNLRILQHFFLGPQPGSLTVTLQLICLGTQRWPLFSQMFGAERKRIEMKYGHAPPPRLHKCTWSGRLCSGQFELCIPPCSGITTNSWWIHGELVFCCGILGD
jgi:hypothetical protein